MSLIPPFFINCVLAVGVRDAENKPQWVASAFIYGSSSGGIEDGKPMFYTYLVTNRHVFEGNKVMLIRFNPIGDDAAKEFDVVLEDNAGTRLWMAHPNEKVDVAVIPFYFESAKKQGLEVNFFESGRHAMTCAQMTAAGVAEGDPVFVLGFPMALVGEKRNAVIVRKGSIARIRDTLAGASPTFWVDSFVFPGNSGGPVVTAPEMASIEGTKAPDAANLVGIVAGYLPFRDVAISAQTKEQRVVFVENSGLAAAFTVDCIDETIKAYVASITVPAASELPAEPEPAEQANTPIEKTSVKA